MSYLSHYHRLDEILQSFAIFFCNLMKRLYLCTKYEYVHTNNRYVITKTYLQLRNHEKKQLRQVSVDKDERNDCHGMGRDQDSFGKNRKDSRCGRFVCRYI